MFINLYSPLLAGTEKFPYKRRFHILDEVLNCKGGKKKHEFNLINVFHQKRTSIFTPGSRSGNSMNAVPDPEPQPYV